LKSQFKDNGIEIALAGVNDGQSEDEVRGLLRESIVARTRVVLLICPADYAYRIMSVADAYQLELQILWLDPSPLGQMAAFSQLADSNPPFTYNKALFSIHSNANATKADTFFNRLTNRTNSLCDLPHLLRPNV